MISHDTGRFIWPYGYDMLDTPNFERLKSGKHYVFASLL